jgi:hypothetical protein
MRHQPAAATTKGSFYGLWRITPPGLINCPAIARSAVQAVLGSETDGQKYMGSLGKGVLRHKQVISPSPARTLTHSLVTRIGRLNANLSKRTAQIDVLFMPLCRSEHPCRRRRFHHRYGTTTRMTRLISNTNTGQRLENNPLSKFKTHMQRQ